MVSPMVLAIQSRYLDDPEQEYELPTTIQTLLWACYPPHDFGAPEVSPLFEAIRVEMIWQQEFPIIVAAARRSASCVQILLAYGADPCSAEQIP